MGLVVVGYAPGPAILDRCLKNVPSVSVIGISIAACAVAYAPGAAAQWPHAMPGAGGPQRKSRRVHHLRDPRHMMIVMLRGEECYIDQTHWCAQARMARRTFER